MSSDINVMLVSNKNNNKTISTESWVTAAEAPTTPWATQDITLVFVGVCVCVW